VDSAPEFAKRPHKKQRRKIPLGKIIGIVFGIGMLASIILPTIGSVHTPAPKQIDWNSLRTIQSAMLNYTTDPDNSSGTLPSADFFSVPVGYAGSGRRKDVYEVAAMLVRNSDMPNEAWLWISKFDSTFPPPPRDQLTTVIDSSHDGFIRNAPINPKFHGAALAFAVAIFPPGTKLNDLPTTTPLIWTRGLQPNGTWSKTLGTYGDWGGFIVFAGQNMEKFTSIDGKLVKFGTNEPTSNILEALPPGSRISEFTPPKK
jgi:hypothetical protein